MPSQTKIRAFLLLFSFGAALSPARAWAQGVSVSLQVTVDTFKTSSQQQHLSTAMRQTMPKVVAWLTPANASEALAHHSPGSSRNFVLSQKDKQFIPHLLVVPTGSIVDFPNLDPFFHNVFSLFNGRRFDLGLYEAGSRRSVRFDNDGVSYIFCNIHPEMGAIVVSISTPYYAVSSTDGSLNLPNIPPGDYELSLWSENVSNTDLSAAKRRIHVSAQPLRLPPISLRPAVRLLDHLNKFGEPYKEPRQAPY